MLVLALPSIALVSLAACGRPARPGVEEHVFRGETMGTTYVVKLVAALDAGARAQITQMISAELDRVDGLMSHYRPDSELSRFNRHESKDPFHVSPETFAVFEEAARVSRLSGGALDVTIAPLVDAWGFGPAAPRELPRADEIVRLLRRVGHEGIALDPERRTLSKRDPGIMANLSAVAKGYAADRVAQLLGTMGRRRVMVEVGGEIVAAGTNGGDEPWQIAIEQPTPGSTALHRIVTLRDRALATSGDYRNYREVDGVRIAHTIDPRSGRPLSHRLASVTVIDDTCVRADALATALMVLGPTEALALAEQQGIAALLIVSTDGGGFSERATTSFEALQDRAP